MNTNSPDNPGNVGRRGVRISRVFFLLCALVLLQQPIAVLGQPAAGKSPFIEPAAERQANAGLCAIRFYHSGTERDPAREETIYVECSDDSAPPSDATDGFNLLDVPPAPILLSPANNSTLNTLIPIENIDAQLSGVRISPRIDISTDPTFQSINFWTTYCGWTQRYYERKPFWNLRANTRYYWRARTAYGNACGDPSPNWGPSSQVWSLYVTSAGTLLPAPILVTPPNGAAISNLRPTFQWQGVAGALGYELWVTDRTSGLRRLYYSWDQTQTSVTLGSDLDQGHTYEWWAQFRNNYAWGSEPEHWTFTIGGASNSISGRVTDASGNGISAVLVSDNAGHSTTTDSGGGYVLGGLSQGSFVVTPSKAGYTFSPSSRTVAVPPSAQNINFTGTRSDYSISGRVRDSDGRGITGVTISVGARQVTTDGNGNYVISQLGPGSHTITPSRSGYTFCPRSNHAAVPPNQTGQNFSGSHSGTDLGLCPEPDGFVFKNKQLSNFSENMFRQLFSGASITKPNGELCDHAKQHYETEFIPAGNGWSCVGFSLTSLLNWMNWDQPYAGSYAMSHYERLFDQPESIQLTDPIAYYSRWQRVKQYADEYKAWKDTCASDPSQMVERIRQGIQSRSPMLLALNADTTYHAVVPYRVVNVEPDIVDVFIYDSERPGEERVVRFELSGNVWQWTYTFVGSLASSGTVTRHCLDMYLITVANVLEQAQPLEDYCQQPTSGTDKLPNTLSNATGRLLANLPAQGDWLIRDTLGRRLGWTGGVLVSEIPGAYELPQATGDASLAYRSLYLPAATYSLNAVSTANRDIDYTLFADGTYIDVIGKSMQPGTTSSFEVSRDLAHLTLANPQSVRWLAVVLERELPLVSRVATLQVNSPTGSANLDVEFDDQQIIVSRTSGNLSYELFLQQPNGQRGYFVSEAIMLEPNEAHILAPSSWNDLSAGTVLLQIDQGINGTIDETITLENMAHSVFLPVIAHN